MDNPETPTTLGTHNTKRKQTKQKTQHRKIQRWATRTPTKKKMVEHRCSRTSPCALPTFSVCNVITKPTVVNIFT